MAKCEVLVLFGWMGSSARDADLAASSRVLGTTRTPQRLNNHTDSRHTDTKIDSDAQHDGASSQILKEGWHYQHAAAQHTATWLAACKANHFEVRQNYASAKHTRSATKEAFSRPARRNQNFGL
jgi:hypothetical protein